MQVCYEKDEWNEIKGICKADKDGSIEENEYKIEK